MPLMATYNDPHYLRTAQYATAANLNARVALHHRFSTNRYGWRRWLFEQMGVQAGQQVLEIGGGPGGLWQENQARLPAARVVVSDFSLGMVAEARAVLASLPSFSFVNLDAQALPMTAEKFDAVYAHHMLYHVPDIPRAAREMARVLKPGARLYAATNGLGHLRELHALVDEFDPAAARQATGDEIVRAFGLETGPDLLVGAFANLTIRRYPDALWVTEAKPLVDYILSFARWGHFGVVMAERAAELAAFVQKRIAATGGLRITKETGVIVAWN